MTIDNMDISLNISSGPTIPASAKVQRNKSDFYKPHVKRLIKKSQANDDKNKNQPKNAASEGKIGGATVRVKQKSLAAIVAKNVARSKALPVHNSNKNVSNNFKASTGRKVSFSNETETQQNGKPMVAFTKPTEENALKTILAKPRQEDEQKSKKSLSDIFSKGAVSSNTETKLLPLNPKVDDDNESGNRTWYQKFPHAKNSQQFKDDRQSQFGGRDNRQNNRNFNRPNFSKSQDNEEKQKDSQIDAKEQNNESADKPMLEKFPHARNMVLSQDNTRPSQFGRRDNRQNNRNFNKPGFPKSDDKQEKPNYNKPSSKVSSLFGNNPEVPNIGQRFVKPVNEAVFSKTNFSDLGVHDYMVSNLEQNMQITNMTTVQQRAIPVILSGRNVLVRSQTGSGKTLAYALPIVETLHKIRPKLMRNSGLRALVVVPTRELALQTYECFLKLVKPFTWIVPGYLVGGEKRKAEKARLRRGCTILVATPGRLLDHIKHTEALKLSDVKCFVLDEADRMLDMGYEKDISGIVDALKDSNSGGEKSDYDPLQLIRDNGKKIIEAEDEKEEEINCRKDGNKKVESKGGNAGPEEEDDEEDDDKPNKQEYHSGTDSDSEEQEFPIRMKKTKKDLSGKSKKIVETRACEEKATETEASDSEITTDSSRQTILLSATLTAAVEKLAGLTMTNPAFVDAAQENLSKVGGNLSETNEDLVVPQGVVQSYIVTPPKLRMVTLSAYIAGKCQVAGQHKILVFMATQDMIDYHAEILPKILGKPRDDDDEDSDPLVDVEFFKLHGSMSQKERTEVFKTFRKARSGVLLCTDVASRGLDMPKVDTVVQYTGPLSARDYVHRIGRTARAGTSGMSTIFLTPPEVEFVRMLESRRIRIKQDDMNDVLDKLMGPLSKHRTVEATATALQNEFETLVLENKNFHSKACKAYVSWIRFYSSYPRDMREIFNRRDLHLGHYAKSFALRDPPQRIGGIGKTLREKEPAQQQHNNRLSNERPARLPQKRQAGAPAGGQKPGMLKRSRMLNTSEYGSGLEPIKKSKKL